MSLNTIQSSNLYLCSHALQLCGRQVTDRAVYVLYQLSYTARVRCRGRSRTYNIVLTCSSLVLCSPAGSETCATSDCTELLSHFQCSSLVLCSRNSKLSEATIGGRS